MPRRIRKMKGGFLDSLTSSLSNGWNSLSNSASNAYNKTKNSVTNYSTGSSSYYPSQPAYSTGAYQNQPAYSTGSYQNQPSSYSYGGKTRKHKRGGSYSSSISVNGLAANAAPVSNVKTAQPHNLVGGKSKKHRKHKHKHSKSCKHKKH